MLTKVADMVCNKQVSFMQRFGKRGKHNNILPQGRFFQASPIGQAHQLRPVSHIKRKIRYENESQRSSDRE